MNIANDCWSIVLSFLSFSDCLNLSLVSKTFYNLLLNQKFRHKIQLYCYNQTQYNFQGVYKSNDKIFAIHEIHDIENQYKKPHFFHIVKNVDKIQLTIKDKKIFIEFTDFEIAKKEILNILCKYFSNDTFKLKEFYQTLSDKNKSIYVKLIEISGWINSETEKDRKWIENNLLNHFKRIQNIDLNDDLYEIVTHPSCENIILSDYKRKFKRFIKFREDGYLMKKMKEIPHYLEEVFEKIQSRCCMEMATYFGFYFCRLCCCPCYTVVLFGALTYSKLSDENFTEEQAQPFDLRSDY